jgi:KDO2-lipid IV(A) lauroyltransferase
MAPKRKLAYKSLTQAFRQEKSPAEIQKLAKACFDNFGRGMIDSIYILDRPKMIEQNVTIEGQEYLDAALKKGKGVIFVGAHFGNFILMYFRMVLAGYATNVIMKRARDAEFEKYISDFRTEHGLKTIYDLPARQCVQQSIKALRNNEVLFILLDQNYGGDGRVFVDFFGRKAATAAGPVVFANRTGAAILPIFMHGQQRNRHKLVIGPEIPLESGDSAQENIESNVAKLTKVIEDEIRKSPHEWAGWMHKRWKSRTIEEQAQIDRESSK